MRLGGDGFVEFEVEPEEIVENGGGGGSLEIGDEVLNNGGEY